MTAHVKELTETLTLSAEGLSVSTGIIFSETLVLSDSDTFSTGIDFEETVTLTATVEPVANKILSETLTLTDTYSKVLDATVTCSETLTLTDGDTYALEIILEETLTLTDICTPGIILEETLTLTDGYTYNTGKILSETLTLTDTYSRVWNAIKTYSETPTLLDNLSYDWTLARTYSETLTLTDDKKIPDYNLIFTETLSLYDTRGVSGEISVYIKNATGQWEEYEDYEYFKVVKKQNQISEFEMYIADIEASDKVFVKEFAEVLILSNYSLVLKGRIQKVTYETAYACKITGFGMEAELLDKEFSELSNTTATWSDNKRAQYTNASAQTIAKELLSANSDGAATWIMNPALDGIFLTDYGNISIRFEYANRLKALAALAESLVDPTYQGVYEWNVSQSRIDDYNLSSFNLASLCPSVTRATVSQETFAITGSSANASQTFNEKDVTNLANKIDVLGYGDGINQIHTSTYNASPTYSTLVSDITASSTSIELADASDFTSSGEIRIMEERVTYSGKTSNTLTGCTRGANSTTARVHKRGVYVEKYVALASPEADSSIDDNGLMDYSVTDRGLLDLPTAELVATKLLLERMTPIISIRIIPDDPMTTAENRQVGDLITVTDAESAISGDYRIVGMTYISDYGYLSMEIEVSNKTLNFLEQMGSVKEETQKLSKYMQGSTNIYAINEAENCDAAVPLNLRFYLPIEAIAINTVLLSFKLEDYRAYSTSNAAESAHTHNLEIGDSTEIVADTAVDVVTLSRQDGALYVGYGTGGTPVSSTGSSHTHGIDYGIEQQTLTSPSVDLSVGTEGAESAVGTYTSDQENVDITSYVSAVGAGNWINIKFEANKNMRIEANAYIQIFIRSR